MAVAVDPETFVREVDGNPEIVQEGENNKCIKENGEYQCCKLLIFSISSIDYLFAEIMSFLSKEINKFTILHTALSGIQTMA